METLILTFDTIAMMVVIYFSFKSEKSPDQPELGPFRIKVAPPPEPVPAKPTRQNRPR